MTTFWAIALTLYLAPLVIVGVLLVEFYLRELFVHIAREVDEQ